MSEAISLPPETVEKVFQVGSLDVVSSGTNRIDRFLSVLPKRNGSDLHLAVGSPPVLRIDGDLEKIRYRALSEGDFYNLVGPISPPRIWNQYNETGDVDFACRAGYASRRRSIMSAVCIRGSIGPRPKVSSRRRRSSAPARSGSCRREWWRSCTSRW